MPDLHTLFEPAQDIGVMREFYAELLGLAQTFFDPEKGWLCLQAGPVQLVFTVPAGPVERVQDWSRTPAWDGGTVDRPSWAFRLSLQEFDALLVRLTSNSCPVELREEDQGRLRRAFVLDPMGKTVELYYESEQGER